MWGELMWTSSSDKKFRFHFIVKILVLFQKLDPKSLLKVEIHMNLS